MSKPLPDSRIDQLIADYLADSLSDADRPVFEDWLRASPENPRRVARLSVTDYAIREVCQDTKADYLLDVLNQIDDAAGPAQLVTLHHIDSRWQRYRLPFAIGGAIAAVLLIAVTLSITLQGPASVPSLATDTTTPNKPAASMQSTPRGSTVATLTAEHDAVWASPQAEGALAPGSALRAGTRLTLTAGFAEITTNDGAVAIIEAPATIELIDNNNAIRLHTGKLVGICETDSSKGFLVRTPHMDITDLGTRFGVDVQEDGSSSTKVLTGSVRIAPTSANAEPIELTAGRSYAMNELGMVLPPASVEQGLFAGMLAIYDRAPSLSGDVSYVSADEFIGKDSDRWPTAARAKVFAEPIRMRLEADLPVSNSGVGKLSVHLFGATLQDPPVVPAGTMIRSYIVAMNPQQREGVTDVSGSVTFDGQVLGVIYTDAQWQNFLRVAREEGQQPFEMDQNLFIESVEVSGAARPFQSDQLTVSQDRHTLNFRIYSKGYCDLFRVILRDPVDEEQPD